MPTCSSFTNFCRCQSTSTSRQTSQSLLMSGRTTFWPLDTQNLFKPVMETSLKKSCLGSLYLANSEAIQTTCKFKVVEASEWIFELAENTWAVYTTGTINTNQVWDAKNTIQTCQINLGAVAPGCCIRTIYHEYKTIEIQKKTMNWTRELAELFDRAQHRGHPHRHSGPEDEIQRRIRCQ